LKHGNLPLDVFPGSPGFFVLFGERFLDSSLCRFYFLGLPLRALDELLSARPRSDEHSVCLLLGFVTHAFSCAMSGDQYLTYGLLH
jgi:hypothetical protein